MRKEMLRNSNNSSVLIKLAILDASTGSFKGPYPVRYKTGTLLREFITRLAPWIDSKRARFFTNLSNSSVDQIRGTIRSSSDWCHILVVVNTDADTKDELLKHLANTNKKKISSFLSSTSSDILETSVSIKRVKGDVLVQSESGEVFKGIMSFKREESGFSFYYHTEKELKMINASDTAQKKEHSLTAFTDIASKTDNFCFEYIVSAVKAGDAIIVEHEKSGQVELKTFLLEPGSELCYRDSGNRINLMRLPELYKGVSLRFAFRMNPPKDHFIEPSFLKAYKLIHKLSKSKGLEPSAIFRLDEGEYAISAYKDNRVYVYRFREADDSFEQLISFPHSSSLENMVYLKSVGAFLVSFPESPAIYLIEPQIEKPKNVENLFNPGPKDFSAYGSVVDMVVLNSTSDSEVVILCQEKRITYHIIQDIGEIDDS